MVDIKSFIFVFVCLVAMSFSCKSTDLAKTNDLVVMEQKDTICGSREANRHSCVSFCVDVPVNGPKALVDSVMAQVNREMYQMCEHYVACGNRHDGHVAYSEKEMFTRDGARLLDHYLKKYKPIIEENLCDTYGIEMKMEAQTEKYVTYGVKRFLGEIRCASEKYYYTFDKNDGHLVKEIISEENLARFFKDYPEYNSVEEDLLFGRAGWRFVPGDDTYSYDFGLLDDHFSIAIKGGNAHYLLLSFPYGQIFSYLSPEVQALVERHEENEPMLPAYLPHGNGEVYLEVDTVHYALIGCVSVAGGEIRDTLLHYDPALEIYPKQVYTIDIFSLGDPLYLLTYSFGHLTYLDEAMTCIYNDNHHLQPISLFPVNGQRDSVMSCMWYDQPLEASGGFPFDEFDENRFGLHYDWLTKRLYYPVLESHDPDSEFANTSCRRYTGRFAILQFDGKEFKQTGEDGAWWLNKELRNYKRTVSNKRLPNGIEQIDLMPDGTFRRAFWKGAKTLDDLRKKPDEVNINKQNVFSN